MIKRFNFWTYVFFILSSTLLFAGNPHSIQTIAVNVNIQNTLQLEGPEPDFEISGSDLKPGKKAEIDNDLTSFVVLVGDSTTKKIMACLNEELPNGFEMYVYLSPPQGSRTTGLQKLSTVNIDVMRDIVKKNNTYTPSTIDYHLYYGREGLDSGSFTRQIIYTLVDQ